MTASTVLGGGSHIGGLSVHRAVAEGVTPDDSKRMMAALLPDFSRALQLGFLHADKLSAAYWEGVLTERSDPVLLIDEQGRFIRGGAAVERIFAAADGLDIRAGRLHACDPTSHERLRMLLARAVACVSPIGGSVPVRRPSGRAAYLVTALPLPRAIRMLAPFGAAALVTIVDPTARIRTNADRWRDAFGLTAREAELAALLMQGHSVDSAAHVLGIVTGTARLHLRHALAKTGVSRQADMIRLLSRL
ncbi:helix-turn-helix transcriptional regulator [Sphingomonas bacterium]|uniref:helix-turn-helix transcriptional regulator n=1 Tax=Sphingomonas bacterium TaxID=1895847 RepID=UPI001574FE2B|nr:helix-turn-helix transcriptional regulator [Sphingomonas bacterium]